MRFIVFMIPGVYQQGRKVAADFAPPADMVEKMMKFNDELVKAGALISLATGCSHSRMARGSRFPVASRTVTDGPYVEAKEVVGGYWMLQFKSKQEAVEWMKRCPAQDGDVIEIRPVFEMSDFPADVQKAASR